MKMNLVQLGEGGMDASGELPPPPPTLGVGGMRHDVRTEMLLLGRRQQPSPTSASSTSSADGAAVRLP